MKITKIEHEDRIEYKNELGQWHREDGPALEFIAGLFKGEKSWYINGKLYRLDGPTIEYPDGTKYWYINDNLHRLDGPAIEYLNGEKYWYYHNKRIDCKTQEEFERLIKLAIHW